MRQMKNSGIEWIGDIPADWRIVPIRYAFSEITDKNIDGNITKALQFKFGSIIPKSNFDAECDGYVADTILNYTIVEPRTIMINGLNLNYDFKTLRVGLVKEKGVITSAYMALKPNESIVDAEFATYLFKGYESKLAFHNMGAGIRLTLGFKEFKKQPLLLPSLSEQKAIADFLDRICAEIDAVIAKTKATIEEYKKLKQSVITEAVTKGIRGDCEIKESGIKWIGTIPRSWCVRKLKTFASLISKGSTPKDISNEQNHTYNIRFLKSENIVDNQLVSMPEFYIEEHIHSGELKRSALTVDDILFVIAGASIGKVAIMKADLLPSNTNQAVSFIRIMPKYSDIQKYIWYVLQSDMIKTYISLFSVQSAQPNISMENLGNFRLPYIDDNEEIAEIVEYLDMKCAEIDTLIAKKIALLEEMENYKKSVIYEYVTGKKEVK